jgi:hypothetical protein
MVTTGMPDRNGKAVVEAGDVGGSSLRPSPILPISGSTSTFFAKESTKKVKAGQAKLVLWEDIKDKPPSQLKISPISNPLQIQSILIYP